MTPENEALAAELADLQRQIGEVRKERMAAERNALSGDSVEIAIADAERDRDAKTSPQIGELREQTHRLWERLEAAWRSADSKRLRLGRLAERGIEVAGPGGFAKGSALLMLLDEEEHERENAKSALDALGGPPVDVPKAVPLADVRAALGDRYGERVDDWQKLAETQAAYDARVRSARKGHNNEGVRRG